MICSKEIKKLLLSLVYYNSKNETKVCQMQFQNISLSISYAFGIAIGYVWHDRHSHFDTGFDSNWIIFRTAYFCKAL